MGAAHHKRMRSLADVGNDGLVPLVASYGEVEIHVSLIALSLVISFKKSFSCTHLSYATIYRI